MPSQTVLAQLLLRRFRWLDDALRESLEASGWPAITPAQSMVFANLSPEGSTATELAARIGVTRQAVQQTIAGLVREGLLEAAGPGADRRERTVRLTALGAQNVTAALAVFSGIEARLEQQLGERPMRVLRATLAADWGDPPQVSAPPPPRGRARPGPSE
ncbi:MAG: MarR family transcriptional regulator [Actinobacteria bacterium]|nr:MarR family transcriptional regulator [Actinomycetota bacterium]MCI0678177.1 MarR family transcriptional regulator [Actinomycetota bacterium]